MYSDANVRAPYVWWSGAISNPNNSSRDWEPVDISQDPTCCSVALVV